MFSPLYKLHKKKNVKPVAIGKGVSGAGAGKRICVVSDTRVTKSSADQVAQWLARDGWKVTLLDLSPYGRNGKDASYKYVKLAGSFEERNWYVPMQALCAYHWLKAETFDVILFHHGFGAGYFCCMAKKLGVAFGQTSIVVMPDTPYAFWLETAQHLPTFETLRTDAEIDYFERMTVAGGDAALFTDKSVVDWLRAADWALPHAIALLDAKGAAAGKWLVKRKTSKTSASKKKKPPLISVCIATGGKSKFLEELRHSLNQQTAKNFEVLLLNKSRDPIKKAKGSYLLFLDEDDVLLPDAIEVLTGSLQSSAVDILTFVQGKHPHSDSTNATRARLPARISGKSNPVNLSWIYYGANMTTALYENVIGDTSVLFRKDIFLKLQKTCAEPANANLLIHAAQKGCRIDAMPEILVLSRRDKNKRTIWHENRFVDDMQALAAIAEMLPPALRSLVLPFRSRHNIEKQITRFPNAQQAKANDYTPPKPFAVTKTSAGPIKVVFCADDNYLMQTCVAIASVLCTTKNPVEIFLVTTMSKQSVAHIQSVARHFGGQVTIIPADKSYSEKLPAGSMMRGSSAPYLRLWLPDYLPKLDKVIYLDSDIIVRRDLADLWSVDLEDNLLAAARDLFTYQYKEYVADFGGDYFNAGVLVLNLPEWREQKIGSKTIAAIAHFAATNHPFPFHDQSPLNRAVNGRWVVLHPTWNYHEDIDDRHLKLLHLDGPGLKDLKTDAAICHFLGLKKPWQLDADKNSLYAHEYGVYKKVIDALIKRSQDL